MKIEEALKETGKAFLEDFESSYVEINEEGYLAWYNMKNQRELDKVEFECIVDNCWQSYHEVKEIRPEKAGELWNRDNVGICFVINNPGCTVDVVWPDGDTDTIRPMIHNKNGWARLFPKVEDDSVERIEIEGVKFDNSCDSCNYPSPVKSYNTHTKEFGEQLKELCEKPLMKMILEIPKT